MLTTYPLTVCEQTQGAIDLSQDDFYTLTKALAWKLDQTQDGTPTAAQTLEAWQWAREKFSQYWQNPYSLRNERAHLLTREDLRYLLTITREYQAAQPYDSADAIAADDTQSNLAFGLHHWKPASTPTLEAIGA